MGAAYELAGNRLTLLSAYASLGTDCVEANRECVGIWPAEVVERWYGYLKTLPDFASAPKKDRAIRELIRNSNDCKLSWRSFSTFLAPYLDANPSVRDDWTSRKKQIKAWLG
jgi:hypothetical protein